MSNRFGVRRLDAAFTSIKLFRFQSGVKPPHSKKALLFVLVLLLTACKSQGEPAAATNGAPPETIVSSTPPFPTKEPERYQATRTITIVTPDGKTVVTKTAIARDGDKRRHDSEMSSKRVAYLDLPDGRFVLLPDDKVYADLVAAIGSPMSEEDEITSERLLHDDAGATTYQNLGKEMIGGRNSNKYKTVVNSSSTANVSHSETLIWIDEVLNMPVRSDTTSPDGTRTTMELSNITLDVDKQLFEVPNDYERVSFSELRKRLTATE